MSRELSTGDPAPALRLTAHDGSTVDLADATRNGTVVYFYPKAFTPGCTTEACDFRDNLAALKGQGYDVYGVSGDDPQELQRFVTEYHLPYTLLSDPDHAAAKEWGAWGGTHDQRRDLRGSAAIHVRDRPVREPDPRPVPRGCPGPCGPIGLRTLRRLLNRDASLILRAGSGLLVAR